MSYYRTQQTFPRFVTYDHTNISPALCMTRHDVSGWYMITIIYSVQISKIDFTSFHKNSNYPIKNHLTPEIITSKTSIKSASIQNSHGKSNQKLKSQQQFFAANTSKSRNPLPSKTAFIFLGIPQNRSGEHYIILGILHSENRKNKSSSKLYIAVSRNISIYKHPVRELTEPRATKFHTADVTMETP